MTAKELIFTTSITVRFTKAELELLRVCGQSHYSPECLAAVTIGGFVWGWRMSLDDEGEAEITATFRELDTVKKILENGAALSLQFEKDRRTALCADISMALTLINRGHKPAEPIPSKIPKGIRLGAVYGMTPENVLEAMSKGEDPKVTAIHDALTLDFAELERKVAAHTFGGIDMASGTDTLRIMGLDVHVVDGVPHHEALLFTEEGKRRALGGLPLDETHVQRLTTKEDDTDSDLPSEPGAS